MSQRPARPSADHTDLLGFGLIGVVVLVMAIGGVCRLVGPERTSYAGEDEALPALSQDAPPEVVGAFTEAHRREFARVHATAEVRIP